jgi:hypothetical protein
VEKTTHSLICKERITGKTRGNEQIRKTERMRGFLEFYLKNGENGRKVKA